MLQMAGARTITTTAYHPAGDGQSERTNQTLEIALRYYVDSAQGGWVRQLPFLEATLNNSDSFTKDRSPNEILYGMKTRTALDLGVADRPLEGEIGEIREAIRLEAATAIKVAQERMARAHDRRHQEPYFATGYAFISLRTGYKLPATRKGKLAAQRLGPFKILRKVGRGAAYELALPDHYRIHPVISVIHLEPAPAPDSDPFHRESPPIEPIVNEVGEDCSKC
jgi:hypothetical protein